jgi:hypothetical protein
MSMAISPDHASASAPRLVVPARRGKVETRQAPEYYPVFIDRFNLPG